MGMDDMRLIDAPECDRAEIAGYMESDGGAIVLRVGDKIGSEAKAAMLAYRKEHGDLPPHDFVWIGAIENLGWESSAADVDGAGSETRSGHHESVGERQGRQPALVRFWRWLTRYRPEAISPERVWFDDDDPLARVLNAAWESGESVAWTEGEPLPEKVAKPRKVERNDL